MTTEQSVIHATSWEDRDRTSKSQTIVAQTRHLSCAGDRLAPFAKQMR